MTYKRSKLRQTDLVFAMWSHLAQSCYSVIGEAIAMEQGEFVLPGPIITKLGEIDYVGDSCTYANFSWIWLVGNCPQIGEI